LDLLLSVISEQIRKRRHEKALDFHEGGKALMKKLCSSDFHSFMQCPHVLSFSTLKLLLIKSSRVERG
jgi:hypothetical protein